MLVAAGISRWPAKVTSDISQRLIYARTKVLSTGRPRVAPYLNIQRFPKSSLFFFYTSPPVDLLSPLLMLHIIIHTGYSEISCHQSLLEGATNRFEASLYHYHHP